MSLSVAKQKAEGAGREMAPWICRCGRIGYMARGVVYVLIGILAVMWAFGLGGKATGPNGMFKFIKGIPFGEVILWAIGIGLIGYIIWKGILAIVDPEDKGLKGKGLIARIGYLVSAILNSAIAYNAIKTALHLSSGGEGTQKSISAKVLSEPFGEWAIGIVGSIIIGYGIWEMFNGFKVKFMKELKIYNMNPHEIKMTKKAGKIGLISRGLVFGLIGYFVILTAITSNPRHTKGLGGALSKLAQQPYGHFLLGIAGTGLILYGLYGIIRGRYQYMTL